MHKNKLTTRETQILALIARGFTSTQIAAKLKITQGTVLTHRKNMIKKHRIRNNFALVRLAILNKWI